MNRLKGQVAIVTGGARGIGKAISRLFCKEGAHVIIWDILSDGEQTADDLRKIGANILFQRVNVTQTNEIEDAVKNIISLYGKIDILINNAGIIRDRSFLKMSEEEWHAVINVNLNGVFNASKKVLPFMKEKGYGRIVSASSVNALLGAFGQTNYAATKAAIIGFTRSLAREVGKYGVTVNAVAPGFIETDMTDQIPEEHKQASIAQIPVKRIGTVEDIAHAYLYLASPEAGFVNGEVLNVNGGIIS